MASESVGPRQKRRKVQEEMNNILLVVEASYSVAECVNGDNVGHEKEENDIDKNTSGEPVHADDYSSLQLMEHRSEYYETISEFIHDSDQEPTDSSDDECELLIDDDAAEFSFYALCDDELPTNVYSCNAPIFVHTLSSFFILTLHLFPNIIMF
jgi:hypothetical protein